jgi:hypothetical protein
MLRASSDALQVALQVGYIDVRAACVGTGSPTIDRPRRALLLSQPHRIAAAAISIEIFKKGSQKATLAWLRRNNLRVSDFLRRVLPLRGGFLSYAPPISRLLSENVALFPRSLLASMSCCDSMKLAMSWRGHRGRLVLAGECEWDVGSDGFSGVGFGGVDDGGGWEVRGDRLHQQVSWWKRGRKVGLGCGCGVIDGLHW